MSSAADLAVTGFRPGEESNAGLVGSFEVGVFLGSATDGTAGQAERPDFYKVTLARETDQAALRMLKGGLYRAVGHCGNFTDEFRREISAPDGTLLPAWYERVVEVSAQGVGARGHLRHCLLRALRPDKGPADCGPDQLDMMPAV